ncbi:MAG: serine hydrolase domain-containing protein [Planctomycetota bacterium]
MHASLVLTLPLLAAAGPQDPAPEPVRDLAPLLAEILGDFDVPGLGAVVTTSQGTVALGVAGVRERGSGTPIQPDDRFHIGSCTKSMTATLVALWIEAGELDWDTPLSDALPELAREGDQPWHGATVMQLLSHTAGMPQSLQGYGTTGLAFLSRTKPMPELRRFALAAILEKPPLSAPGTEYLYSNFGYVAAGAIVERLGEASWEEQLRARLFEPLGMESAGFGPPDAPYFVDAEDEGDGDAAPPQPRAHRSGGKPAPAFDNAPALGPAGTVHCSLADWAKYARLHLAGARGTEGLLLTPETFAVLHTAAPATDSTYGGGWVLTRRGWSQGKVIMHDGSNTAWFAYAWLAPEEDFAVLVACNQGGPLGQQAADAAAGRLIAGIAAERQAGEQR